MTAGAEWEVAGGFGEGELGFGALGEGEDGCGTVVRMVLMTVLVERAETVIDA